MQGTLLGKATWLSHGQCALPKVGIGMLYSDLIFLCFWLGCCPGCLKFTTIITGFRWSFHTSYPTSLADMVWMIRDRLWWFQRGKESFTQAANMENILHADALDRRLNMPYMISYPTMKTEVGTTRWKTWSLYKEIKIWPNLCGVLEHVTIFQSRSQPCKHKMYSHTFLHTQKKSFQCKKCVFNKHPVDFQNSGLHTREVWLQ